MVDVGCSDGLARCYAGFMEMKRVKSRCDWNQVIKSLASRNNDDFSGCSQDYHATSFQTDIEC
jgi:hypothetical protein